MLVQEEAPSATAPADTGNPIGLDKPLYTISVAAEILDTHPRTLMMYENLRLVTPYRTSTNRRRYSQRDVITLQTIKRLTRHHGLNLNGAKYVIRCLRLLVEGDVPRPEFLSDIDVTNVAL